ncbi:MAG: transposase [Vulcanimicrobiaceae bacterium]
MRHWPQRSRPDAQVTVHRSPDRRHHQGVGGGGNTAELCRRHGISQTTSYKWKAKFRGMEVSDVAKMHALEDENRRLKRLLADSRLEIDALKVIAEGNF